MNDISNAVFFVNWYKIIKRKSDSPEKQLRLYNMVFAYSFEGLEPPEDDEFYDLFLSWKPNIDASIKRKTAGKNGGTKKGENHRMQNNEPEAPADFMPQAAVSAFGSPLENSEPDTKNLEDGKNSYGKPSENSFFAQKKVLYSNVNEDEDVNEDDDDDDDAASPSSSPGISSENSINTSGDYLNPPEPLEADSLISQHQQRYAQIIFQKFKNAGLPCRNGSYWDFLQSHFKNSLPALRGIHSDDVLKSCDNYIAELQKSESILKQRYTFEAFVNSKNFQKCLPENYHPENFLDYSVMKKNRNNPAANQEREKAKAERERLIAAAPKTCQDCGSQLSDIYGNGRSLYCRKCRTERELNEQNGKWEAVP